jgi:hypothetical protein
MAEVSVSLPRWLNEEPIGNPVICVLVAKHHNKTERCPSLYDVRLSALTTKPKTLAG